jgi:hypothetical protein
MSSYRINLAVTTVENRQNFALRHCPTLGLGKELWSRDTSCRRASRGHFVLCEKPCGECPVHLARLCPRLSNERARPCRWFRSVRPQMLERFSGNRSVYLKMPSAALCNGEDEFGLPYCVRNPISRELLGQRHFELAIPHGYIGKFPEVVAEKESVP